jgi:thiamine pyrophosphate-dependent acetolactate synthase large subunit-like protein
VIDRRDAVRQLVAARGDAAIVAGLGATAWDLAAAGDSALDVPLWGAMGGAVPLGLGVALAQKGRRVVVLTGDGELLMGLGSLATVAVAAPRNLAIVVVDNERYGETGGQPSHTGDGVDLAGVAAACGFASARTVADAADVGDAIGTALNAPGPVLVVLKVGPEDHPLVLPERDPAVIKHRFRSATVPDG